MMVVERTWGYLISFMKRLDLGPPAFGPEYFMAVGHAPLLLPSLLNSKSLLSKHRACVQVARISGPIISAAACLV